MRSASRLSLSVTSWLSPPRSVPPFPRPRHAIPPPGERARRRDRAHADKEETGLTHQNETKKAGKDAGAPSEVLRGVAESLYRTGIAPLERITFSPAGSRTNWRNWATGGGGVALVTRKDLRTRG